MTNLHDNLVQDLGTLGRDAVLSLSQRQKIRDRLFKKIGQIDLLDAVQTHTEVRDMVMPLQQLRSIFQPRQTNLSIPATVGVVFSVFLVTFTTSAFAQDAKPGDPLFGVRKAFEAVQVALVSDPAKKAELRIAIADDRLQNLQTIDGKQLEAVLQESKKAITSAQTTITALKGTDAKTSTDLINKLKALIDNQKITLTTIAKDGGANEEIKKSVLAIRNELDALLPKDVVATKTGNDATTVATDTETSGPVGPSQYYGTLTTSYGQLAININGKIYLIIGPTMDLTNSIGSSVQVYGQVVGKSITTYQLYINNKLIWENTPDKDNNNLPRVEGDQNTSLR